MGLVRLFHDYAYPAAAVWAVATDWDCLKAAVGGLVKYEGLPSGRVTDGQVVRTRVSLFGFMPPFDYTMEVLECDPTQMIVRSHEYGGAVKSWDHTLRVEAIPGGSRLIDHIRIDAGAMSWAYDGWASFMYRRRHAPRLRLLAERAGRS